MMPSSQVDERWERYARSHLKPGFVGYYVVQFDSRDKILRGTKVRPVLADAKSLDVRSMWDQVSRLPNAYSWVIWMVTKGRVVTDHVAVDGPYYFPDVIQEKSNA